MVPLTFNRRFQHNYSLPYNSKQKITCYPNLTFLKIHSLKFICLAGEVGEAHCTFSRSFAGNRVFPRMVLDLKPFPHRLQ